MFQLVRYGHLSFSEAWEMPVAVRHWWMNRLNEDERKREQQQQPATAPIPKWMRDQDAGKKPTKR